MKRVILGGEFICRWFDNEGMITGVGVKKAGNHFNKPTVYVVLG